MDDALVEVMARALDPEAWGLWDKMQLERDRCDETLVTARAALAAINASGNYEIHDSRYIVKLERFVETVAWLLDQTLTDAALENLKGYVNRTQADIQALTAAREEQEG